MRTNYKKEIQDYLDKGRTITKLKPGVCHYPIRFSGHSMIALDHLVNLFTPNL